MDRRIEEQFNLLAPFKLHDATVVVLALIGSHSHNTYVPPTDPQAIDDVDYMGIIIPPINYTLGWRDREWEGLNFQFEELDCVFYSFRKFISLLVKSNPNVLGMLWLKPDCYIEESSEWKSLLRRRNLFSSKRAYNSFMGYAHSQLTKMTSFDLATQTEWEESVELITAAGWSIDNITNPNSKSSPMPDHDAVLVVWKKQGGTISGERNLAIDTILNEAVRNIIKIHARHFQGYMGEKRKSLVKKFGYDTKNAAHLIRLMRMCVEFLDTGEMKVFRDSDADHIRAIKQGNFTIEQVKEEAEQLFEKAKIIKDTTCPLPEDPSVQDIDYLTVDAYLSAYRLREIEAYNDE